MKRICFQISLMAGFALPVMGQQPAEGWSDSGALKFEVRGEKDEVKEVWILPEGKPDGARKLAETMGWGNLRVHISPDDSRVVVQDGGGSLGISLRVFKATGAGADGGFAEVEDLNLGDVLEDWALKRAKAAEGKFLGHRYVRLLGWSADGKKALLSIAGHDPGIEIPGWFAIYDFESGALGFDLEGLNQ